jgi:hypothetical protein
MDIRGNSLKLPSKQRVAKRRFSPEVLGDVQSDQAVAGLRPVIRRAGWLGLAAN